MAEDGEQQQRLNGVAMEQQDDKDRSCLCWHRLTNKKRCLLVLIVILILVVIFFIGLSIVLAKNASKPKEICLTRDCIESAESLVRFMDSKVDPCKDFYMFACGGFLKEHKYFPSDKPWFNAIAQLADAAKQSMRNVLEDTSVNTGSQAVYKMKLVYASCLTSLSSESEEESWRNIFSTFEDVGLGNWHQTLDGQPLDLAPIIAKMTLYGIHHLFHLKLGANSAGNSYAYQISDVEVNNLWLSGADSIDFRNMVFNIFTRLNVSDAKRLADEVYNLEHSLMMLTNPTPDGPRQDFVPSELHTEFPLMDWTRFFEDLFRLAGFEGRPDDKAAVTIPSSTYVSGVMDLLQKTDHVVLKAFLGAKTMIWAGLRSGPDVRRLVRLQRVAWDGERSSEITPVWKFCVKEIYPFFEQAATAEYARVMSSEDMLQDIRGYLDSARESFIEHLPLHTWLDSATIDLVKNKLKNVTVELGYPSTLLNYDLLDKKYEGLEVSQDVYLDNMKQLRAFKILGELKTLKSTERAEWNFSPLEVNAFNNQWENIIVIPISILYPPFFQLHRPKYLNYGSMGFTIAHEMGHTFDISGIGKTSFKWSDEMTERFKKRAQCIVDHYSTYKFTEVNPPKQWDGTKSEPDDIADNISMLHSFLAYEKYKKKHGAEQGLPGLNYTAEQLYYIQFAQTMCTTYTPSGAQQIAADEHSPGDIRVKGTVSLSPFFGDTFNCPKGSPMNPAKKCSLWI